MAAGDISKQIMAEVRDLLSQSEQGMGKQFGTKSLIKNDFLIYNAMNRYQRDFMVYGKTTIGHYDITITSDKTEYDLHKRVFRIFSIKPTAASLIQDYSGIYLPKTHQLKILNTDKHAGDVLEVSAYLKPSKLVSPEGSRDNDSDDNISDTVDPIISMEDYKDLLIEAVLSDYKHIFKQFRSTKEVMDDVKKLANELRPAGLMRTTNNIQSMNSLNLG